MTLRQSSPELESSPAPRTEDAPPAGLLIFLGEDGDVQYAAVREGIQPGWAAPTILRKAALKIEAQLLQ